MQVKLSDAGPGLTPDLVSVRAYVYSQSLPVAVDESLEQRLVVGDGLQDVAVRCDVADGPLAQPGAAQSEDVAGDKVDAKSSE